MEYERSLKKPTASIPKELPNELPNEIQNKFQDQIIVNFIKQFIIYHFFEVSGGVGYKGLGFMVVYKN
jgi:hypothetical protein